MYLYLYLCSVQYWTCSSSPVAVEGLLILFNIHTHTCIYMYMYVCVNII